MGASSSSYVTAEPATYFVDPFIHAKRESTSLTYDIYTTPYLHVYSLSCDVNGHFLYSRTIYF